MRKHPTVVAAVRFDQGITGERLAALVQQVAQQNQSCDFVMERPYGAILSVGQRSAYLCDHIMVAPSPGARFINPAVLYSQAEVSSHLWGRPARCAGYGQRQVAEAVQAFAAGLTRAYGLALVSGFPLLVAPN